jgi:uncharacterized protein YjbI with pentapeptide repeats
MTNQIKLVNDIQKLLNVQRDQLLGYVDLTNEDIEAIVFSENDVVYNYLQEFDIDDNDVNLEELRDLQFIMIQEVEKAKMKKSLNLSNLILCNMDFTNAYLENATFVGSDLRNSSFRNANIRGVDFTNANLENVDFTAAECGAAFINNQYSDTCFKATNLKNANLTDILLYLADFENSNLENANLTNTIFGYANFKGANLKNANITNANFKKANFTNAKLESLCITLNNNLYYLVQNP